jgi:hypothetical protein
MRNAILPLALALAVGCATKRLDSESAPSESSSWSSVEKLPAGTAVRVTERDSDKWYGRILSVSNLNLALELEAGSRSIPRGEVVLIERFPASVPTSIPGAAAGLGAALAVASSATPDVSLQSVAPTHDVLDSAEIPLKDGVYVDALSLVGESAGRVARAVERTRKTVVVYRARE